MYYSSFVPFSPREYKSHSPASSPASEDAGSEDKRYSEAAKLKKDRLREEQRQRRKAVSKLLGVRGMRYLMPGGGQA